MKPLQFLRQFLHFKLDVTVVVTVFDGVQKSYNKFLHVPIVTEIVTVSCTALSVTTIIIEREGCTGQWSLNYPESVCIEVCLCICRGRGRSYSDGGIDKVTESRHNRRAHESQTTITPNPESRDLRVLIRTTKEGGYSTPNYDS